MRLDIHNNRSALPRAVDLESCVPADHPLRRLKLRVHEAFESVAPMMERSLAGATADEIAPEVLLKSRVLMAVYSVRNDRLFCEQLPYNLLWLWFLDYTLHEKPFDHEEFTRCSDRLLSTAPAQIFLFQASELTLADHFECAFPRRAATTLTA
jgi:hypothetical protein